MSLLKPSNYLAKYLYSLKISGKKEIYEVLILMMLNDDFLNSIEEIIRSNLSKVRSENGVLKFEISSSKKYKDIINKICKSNYFKDNFSEYEIRRKRSIMEKILVEVSTQSILEKYLNNNDYKTLNIIPDKTLDKSLGIKNFNPEATSVNINFCEAMFPLINHKLIKNKKEGNKIKLVFDEEENLDDIVKYLKSILGIKNKPKKKKMSLGQSFRILQVDSEIRANLDKYDKNDYEYIEQLITREMSNKYNENLSTESVSKSLQRIKKIRKEINTPKKTNGS